MKTEIIHEGINHKGQKFKIVAFYGTSGFLYTRTYIYDSEGFVDKDIKVFADGTVHEN